jgi:hypothetical protein
LKRKVLSIFLVLTLIVGSVGFAFADSAYTVKDGDALWKIAEKYQTTWQALAEYNKLANPNLIYVNQKLAIPDGSSVKPAPAPVQPTPAEPAKPAVQVPDQVKAEYEKLLSSVDQEYAYGIAKELATNPKYLSSSLGGRNAGSDAEHAAAEYLFGEMKKIGLTDTEKVGVKVDKWQFNGSSLTLDGDSKVILPYSYATASTPKEGITAEIVYLGKGTMNDYAGKDVKGKIVLIDLDQRSDWWVTYPMLEAQFQGAAAIMSAVAMKRRQREELGDARTHHRRRGLRSGGVECHPDGRSHRGGPALRGPRQHVGGRDLLLHPRKVGRGEWTGRSGRRRSGLLAAGKRILHLLRTHSGQPGS